MFTKKYVVLEGEDPGSVSFGIGAKGAEALEAKEVELSESEHSDLKRDPKVRAVAPSMPMRLIEPVEIQSFVSFFQAKATWGIKAVKATESKYDGEGVTVAVLDTGIDLDHPAFAGRDIETKNFTEDVDQDTNGHGTHCAGTIFGQDIDGVRIGVARGIDKALVGKVLGKGGGMSPTIIKALQWAINNGANVISMSLGIDFPGYVEWMVKQHGLDIQPATSIALEDYRANVNLFTEFSNFVESLGSFGPGVIIVAAAGNESKRPKYEIAVSPPAAGKGIVSVAALKDGKQGFSVASFSNNNADISAPGVQVESAWPGGGMKVISGTSMATPHVAGVAALWAQYLLEEAGEIEAELLRSKLLASGTKKPLAKGSKPIDVGAGIVQAPL